MENETQQDYEDRLESYRENHGNDHDDEIREEKERMDMRDHFDAYGY
jgi:hypothetical protein